MLGFLVLFRPGSIVFMARCLSEIPYGILFKGVPMVFTRPSFEGLLDPRRSNKVDEPALL